MNVVDILKWAAGSTEALPQLEGINDDRILSLLGIDEGQLIDLLQRHRLAHRFLHRFRQERPAWCSRPLLARMIEQCGIAERQTRLQLGVLREIAQAVASRGHPLIPIKGFTTYALTGNPAHIRWGEDLDLFCCDLEYLQATLLHLGFTERVTFRFNQFDLVSCNDLTQDITCLAPEVNGQHELAKLVREDVKIEIHGYFPVFTYPSGVTQTDLTPAHNLGCWKQTFPNTLARGILYKDLLASAVQGIAPGTERFTIPEPTLSVLLRCAHIFAHYALVGPFEDWMPLKLVELAEIRDVAQDTRFDRSRFLQWLQKFGAHDAVHLASYLLRVYLGSNALEFACSSRRQRPDNFPRFFQWWRFWADYYPPGKRDNLLLPTHLDAVIQELGTNSIRVSRGRNSPYYSLLDRENSQTLQRSIFHSREGKKIPLQFSVSSEGDEIRFDIELLEPLPDHNYRYCLDLVGSATITGDYLHTIERDSAGWSQEPGLPSKHRSRHTYKWSDTSKPFLVLLIVGMQDKRKDFFFSFDPALLVPLSITRG